MTYSATVSDLIRDELSTDPTTNHAEHAIAFTHQALLSLVNALAWLDAEAHAPQPPRLAEYVESLLEMHRSDAEPIIASIITAASWIGDQLVGEVA